jgi:manganese-dependent inorganic pyrophosphatase
MVQSGVRSIPVVNAENELKGILKFLDLLQLLMPTSTGAESVRRMPASPIKIQDTLKADSGGAPLERKEREIVLLVGASSSGTVAKRLQKATKKGDVGSYVVICGDRPTVQKAAIDFGIRLLVVTSSFAVDPELIKEAKKKGVSILRCYQDTATVVKLIRCSRMVKTALDPNVLRVMADDSVQGLRKGLASQAQDLFPIINPGDNTLIGVISKSDLIDPSRIRVVMVDHNEYSQAIEGIEDADVIEVIDHHRLAGDIMSREPIRYLNEPVGSSSTLVAREYRYAVVEMPKGIAMCLIAGMISDTLNLTSPTTTDLDREILEWLCQIADIDAAQFTREFFASGSLLAYGTGSEAVKEDRKVFEEAGFRVSISHVEEAGLEHFEKKREELQECLDTLIAHKGYDLALLITTNINAHHSVLLASGDKEILEALPFERDENGVYQAPGVVSRKKQVFPAVCQALRVAAAHR